MMVGSNFMLFILRIQAAKLLSLKPAAIALLSAIFLGLFTSITSIKVDVSFVTRVGDFNSCVYPLTVKRSLTPFWSPFLR